MVFYQKKIASSCYIEILNRFCLGDCIQIGVFKRILTKVDGVFSIFQVRVLKILQYRTTSFAVLRLERLWARSDHWRL
jgi:hypothetical protein